MMGFITFKLKQPTVVGYILAGMVIGPYTPPFTLIHEVNTLNLLAELGIIILLFVIGTEFPIAKLRSVGRIFDHCRSCRIIRNDAYYILCGKNTGVFTI